MDGFFSGSESNTLKVLASSVVGMLGLNEIIGVIRKPNRFLRSKTHLLRHACIFIRCISTIKEIVVLSRNIPSAWSNIPLICIV